MTSITLDTCGSWGEGIENSWRNGVMCSYLGVIVIERWLKDSIFCYISIVLENMEGRVI